VQRQPDLQQRRVRVIRSRRTLAGALAAAALAWAPACAPGFLHRVPGAPTGCTRIAAGPAVVSVVEFDAGGGLKPRADWTHDATLNVDAGVAERVKRGGGRTYVAADVAHTDVTSDDFRRWASGALQEIAGKIAGTRASPRRSVGEWQFGQSLATWRPALGADLVLAVLFVDAYEPTAAASPGSSRSTSSRYDAAQTGIACLVDLGDGRIVACGASARRFGDLRTPEAARDAVAEVVDGICGSGR
jgi:hypothetical protein